MMDFRRPALVVVLALSSALAGDAFNPPSEQWSAHAAAAAVTGYRATISPLLARSGVVRCRYRPTCSAYAAEALRRRGFFPGTALAAWRVVRCNPFSKGGFDPVP
jgi:putative membrane protein insertion efficiency factor